MTQYERIRKYMEAHGSITPMDAFLDLGITKLSTRVGEMIQSGEKIRKSIVSGKNRFGEPVRYMKYEKAV